MKYLKQFEKYYSLFNEVFLFREFIQQHVTVEKNFSIEEIEEWMRKYDFDEFAYVMWISEEKANRIDIDKDAYQHKEFIFKNRAFKSTYFDENAKTNKGQIIRESDIGGGIYLYLFDKNKNQYCRTARQVHGFNYQEFITKENDFILTDYTNKWDTVGKLSYKFLKDKLDEGKEISVSDLDPIKKETLSSFLKYSVFNHWMPWSIKLIKYKGGIDMGDFKRVSDIFYNSEYDRFCFNIGFWRNNTGNITDEYFTVISQDKWSEYLPHDNFYKYDYDEMYRELKTFKARGTSSTEDKRWQDFMDKYSGLAGDSIIKLRFKRDSKHQLRIQCSINYKDFENIILRENKYLHINDTTYNDI